VLFRPVSLAERERRIAAILAAPSLNKAADSLGMPQSTLKQWARTNKDRLRQTSAISPIIRPAHITKILAVGDCHDSPHISDKSRFEWIGKHARSINADYIAQVGDFMSMDSICRYVPDETHSGRLKGTVLEEFESGNLALDAIDAGLNGHPCKKHITFGNHEWRIDSYSERNPAIYGMLMMQLEDMFKHRKWTHSPFKAYHSIAGVDFTHVPHSKMGKPMGANEITIANQFTSDVVFGHTHVARAITAPKLGSKSLVTIINPGCALPYGYVEPYAKHTLTGWSWGVMELTVEDGSIRDFAFVSMKTLEEQYK